MKKAVPGHNSIELMIERQCSHVADMPFVLGELTRASGDHCPRPVNPGHLAAASDEVAGDRHAGTAANVEDRGLVREQSQKRVEPSLFGQAIGTVTRPRVGVTLIDVDDAA